MAVPASSASLQDVTGVFSFNTNIFKGKKNGVSRF